MCIEAVGYRVGTILAHRQRHQVPANHTSCLAHINPSRRLEDASTFCTSCTLRETVTQRRHALAAV